MANTKKLIKDDDKRQLLIESTEFISEIKLSKDLKEAVQLSAGKAGTLIVKNIPCTILNRENQNGRIYSTAIMQEALDEARDAIKTKQLLSQADEHPEGSFVAPSHASHVVINAYIKPNVEIVVEGERGRHDVLFMDWEVLNTQEGKNLRALFEAECSIGTSIRGVGDMNGKTVENYSLLGVDVVGNPSSSTYTRMPVSESVKVELIDNKSLKETFNVTTSSTNVVRDLEKASVLQAQLDNIGYGTVTKTSTKVDEETDPKTGAQTSITTLEAETSDDVADLDQALMMAKNAMLNGTVNIDSITIENIKEEEPKESACNGNEKALKEEDRDNDEERYGKCSWCGEEFPLSDLKKEKDMGYLCNRCAKGIESREGPLSWENEYVPESTMNEGVDKLKDAISALMYNEGLTLEQACRKFCEQHENIPYDYILEYMRPTVTEAKEEKEKDPKEGKKFVLKTPAGFVAMDGNALVFKEDPKEALHFVVGKEESGLVHLSGVEKILDTMGVYDVEKYYRKDTTDISAKDGEIASNTTPVENKEKGKGVEEANILDGTPAVNLSGQEEVHASLGEEQGDVMNTTKYSAIVRTDGVGNAPEVVTVPVSSVDMEPLLAEVSNLWDMKSRATRGHVDIDVTDNTTGAEMHYDPTQDKLIPLDHRKPMLAQESNEEIEQKDNKLSLELDKDHSIEKEFDTVAQASIAKAGLEQGKLDGDIMMSEAGDPIGVDLTTQTDYQGKLGPVPYTLWFKCTDNNFDLLDNDLKKLYDKRVIWNWDQHSSMPNVLYVTGLNEQGCNALLDNLRKMGNKLVGEDFINTDMDEATNVETIEPGWYVGADGVGVTGPYKSKEEALSGLDEVLPYIDVAYLDGKGDVLDEKIFARPDDASDPYIEKPLDEADKNVQVTLSDLNWDLDAIIQSIAGDMDAQELLNTPEFRQYLKELPETITLNINIENFDNSDPAAIKEMIIIKAREAGYDIRDAEIVNIN